jgi:two-component system LytT family sensor kinase
MGEQTLLVLLVKLAVTASLASVLVRFSAFKRTLLREERTLVQRVLLALSISAAFGGGVAVRVATGTYTAADAGLEGSLLAGIVGGYVPGLLAGVLISLPAMLVNGELLTMPLFAAVGVLGGLVRDVAPDPEEIWNFSPFPDLNVYRVFRYWKHPRRALFHLFFLGSIVVAELLRWSAAKIAPRFLFTLYPAEGGLALAGAIVLTTMLAVILPLRVWASARVELKLATQQGLLQEARLRALTSQINPHFLFNTLNSVASLVRTNPEMARAVIHKLSAILRRLMRKQDSYTTLRDELGFIEDYLSIEMVRFGDKLRFVKEVDEDTLDTPVPSMLLQPIIENSLKHGIASKVDGGTIWLRARKDQGRVYLEVEDDGVGIPEANLANLFERGIGVSNVNERLKVLYEGQYRMWIDSKPGEGTRTGIELPLTRQPAGQALSGIARAS